MDGIINQPTSSLYHYYPDSRVFRQVDQHIGKRRRSRSPLDERPAFAKRPFLHHHHPVPVRSTKLEARHDFHHDIESSVTTSALEAMNERTVRLGLENSFPEDVEVWSGTAATGVPPLDVARGSADSRPCSCSIQMDCGQELDGDESDEVELQLPPTPSASQSFSLPLHRPHPVAYQQHLALSSSKCARRALVSNSQVVNYSLGPKKGCEDCKKKLAGHFTHL